jgi:uncharacterized protein (DUF924 family)
MSATPEEVLAFWFGALGPEGEVEPQTAARWWRRDADFDALVRRTFVDVHAQLVETGGAAFPDGIEARLAAVIVLDQFSRNMFRDTPDMYASDALARRIADEALARPESRALHRVQRQFLAMPFMHSEAIADQERCVEMFREFFAGAKDASAIDFAVRHRDIVARFGRFPHRNAILGRPSTPEELGFLETPGSSF